MYLPCIHKKIYYNHVQTKIKYLKTVLLTLFFQHLKYTIYIIYNVSQVFVKHLQCKLFVSTKTLFKYNHSNQNQTFKNSFTNKKKQFVKQFKVIWPHCKKLFVFWLQLFKFEKFYNSLRYNRYLFALVWPFNTFFEYKLTQWSF